MVSSPQKHHAYEKKVYIYMLKEKANQDRVCEENLERDGKRDEKGTSEKSIKPLK